MNAISNQCDFALRDATRTSPTIPEASLGAYPDPLDEDAADDGIVATTRRGLVRLALVAVETGSRFARDGIGHDPMAWMLAPRRLFGGAAAVDAALGRKDCLRAVLLHGLGLGLDADAAEIDELTRDDDAAGDEASVSLDVPARGADLVADSASPRLFTSTLVGDDAAAGGVMLAFDALVCGSAEELRERVLRRVGEELAGCVAVREGFDASEPVAMALVSDALADQLAHVEAAPASAIAAGLDVVLQHRFAA